MWIAYSSRGTRVESSCWDWTSMLKLIQDYQDEQNMSEEEARAMFWNDVRDYDPKEFDRCLAGRTLDEALGDGSMDEIRSEYLYGVVDCFEVSDELAQDIRVFQQKCDGWHHEYSSVAITNTTLEEVVKVAKEYAKRRAFGTFENCFYNGCEENGVVTFDAYRELPHNIAAFFSINLPDSVVYADIGWDYQDIYIQKDGKDYHEFTARWDDEEPEGYKEDGFEEDEDESDLYYDCFVTLTDNETGYEFHTGGGMCSENEFKMFCSLIHQHPQIQAKTL